MSDSPFKFFKYSEFDCPSEVGSGQKNMDKRFIELIDSARSLCDFPWNISSGFRTKKHNKELIAKGYKASPNSAHLEGKACDIICTDSHKRFKIIQSLLSVGITRIGVSDSFIHCDISTNNKPIEVLWTY